MRLTMPAAFAGLLLLAGVGPALAADLATNKEIVRDYIENAINKRSPDAAKRYFAADYIEHNPHLPRGIAGKEQFIATLITGFSDYHGEIEQVVAEGDEVVTRTRWTGTQDGPFLGKPATGRKLDFATSDFYRIANGKIVEHWDVVDSLPRALSLGLVAPVKSP